MTAFTSQLLSSTLRLSRRSGSSWVVEWVMTGDNMARVSAGRSPLYSQYDLQQAADSAKTVAAIVGEFYSMVHLYSVVTKLNRYMQVPPKDWLGKVKYASSRFR